MFPWRCRPEWLELSDRLLEVEPGTLRRLPVDAAKVQRAFREEGNLWAEAWVAAFPRRAGLLDPDAVDAALLQAHRELQRLALELQQGPRLEAHLLVLLKQLRKATDERPLRLIDVGCGLGYLLRWLACRGRLGSDVELHGADLNPTLCSEAQRLARAEGLACTFHRKDAFQLDLRGHIYLSSGVLHHLSPDALRPFFQGQLRAGAMYLVHTDFQASPLAPYGSWLFHAARMRSALARHDGVLSAARAHPRARLAQAAREAGWQVTWRGEQAALGLPRALHTLIAWRDPTPPPP